jgi:hypothetical protein
MVATLGLLVFSGCHKVADLPYYNDGKAVTLTASKTSVTPTAADANNAVLDFSWTSPEYATDTNTYKYTLEIDSTNRNFTKKVTKIVSGKFGTSFTGNDLNSILADFGFGPNQVYSLDFRVTSSYANNNEQHRSNVVKVDIKTYLVPITLTAAPTTPLTLLVANASDTAIRFNWNKSPYGSGVVRYALQMDLAGNNFANPQVKQVDSVLRKGFTVNDLNNMAIAAGVIGGSTKDVQFRLVSYINGYSTPLATSYTVGINITTFTPVPPTLYIVGDATPGGWANPVSLPSQQFSRIDAVSYGIVINLEAGKSYLFLPVNGSWDHKYGGASATGGALLSDGAVPGSNTPSPAATGLYQIVVNFQTGTYTVTPFTNTIPTNLYIVGDATPGGWANPVPVPDQQFTKIDAVSFGIVINLTAGKSYLLLPENGSWDHKYGGTSATGGTLLADGAVPGSNTPAPAATGNYMIVVNFQTGTYTVTPYGGPMPLPNNLYIVGDATAGGWNNPVPVPAQQFTRVNLTTYQITLPLIGGKSYLLLPLNGNWDHKYGGTSATGGTLLVDGAVPGSNTPAPAADGTYKIVVDFSVPSYTVTAQ